MKRQISFKDKAGNLAKIEIELTDGRFSMSGETGSSCGQCDDNIDPRTIAQRELLAIWRKWHLNDMNAGTEEQTAVISIWAAGKNYDYEKACEFLKSINLYEVPHPDTGKPYKYGHGWLTRALPVDLWPDIEKLCVIIDKEEKEAVRELAPADWDQMTDEIHALALSLEISAAEALESVSRSGNDYKYAGTLYFVGTEEEAEELAREILSDKDCGWKAAVAAGDTTSGKDEWI
jgi:hypothetical protein